MVLERKGMCDVCLDFRFDISWIVRSKYSPRLRVLGL